MVPILERLKYTKFTSSKNINSSIHKNIPGIYGFSISDKMKLSLIVLNLSLVTAIEDCYKLIGVDKKAETKKIKSAYR